MYNECRHILPSGRRCQSPALSGKPFCYYHGRLHQKRLPAGQHVRHLPAFHIEDARGIQMALHQVLAAIESPYVHPRSIGLALYGLQLAIQIVDKAKAPDPAETVRTLSNSEGQPLTQSDELDDNADVLAPECTHCDPGTDCARCLNQDDCSNYEDPDDRDPQFEPEDDEEDDEEEEHEDNQDADSENDDDEQQDSGDNEGDNDENEEDDDEEEDDQEEEDEDGEDLADDDPEEMRLKQAALRILQADTLKRKGPAAHSTTKPKFRTSARE